jgi:hypothetical protein
LIQFRQNDFFEAISLDESCHDPFHQNILKIRRLSGDHILLSDEKHVVEGIITMTLYAMMGSPFHT